MEKLIIKCDKCKKELNAKRDSGYYELNYRNLINNVTFKWSRLDKGVDTTKHICLECFSKLLELK